MILSGFQLAWAIVLMKYHEPDQLQLSFQSRYPLPVWTCNNASLYADADMVLEIKVSIEDTIKDLKAKLYRLLAEYTDVSGRASASLTLPVSASSHGSVWAEELEAVALAYRQLNSHLHGEISLDRLKGHLLKAYEAILRDERVRIKDVDILSPEERSQLLFEFNQTQADYPKGQTIHGLFMRQAAANPNSLAVVCNKESISYAELDRKSSRLAVKLRSLGARPGCIVAITADRTIEMIIGLLAILKSGGAYLPIDLRAPQAHNQLILKDSGAQIAVSKSLSRSAGIELIDPYDPMSYDQKDLHTEWEGHSTDLAYVIYTSGTTGTPKGVMVRHQEVINFCCWLDAKYQIADHPRILQSANLTFDASVESIFGALLNGGTSILIRSELLLHKRAFRDFIRKHQVHIVPLVPSLLSLLTDEDTLESVRVVITGGDVLERELKDRVIAKGYNLYNHYGPTETTVVALATDVEQDRVTLGKPIANTRIYVLNRWLELCPIGVWGEICIAGDGVSRGYLNRDDLSHEKFVAHPYEPGQPLYRTGDIGRWLQDGRVEYAGRADSQLKINSILVHPETIRKHLKTHSSIKEAQILEVKINGINKLVAYYTVNEPVSAVLLREHLLLYIPPAIMPSQFIEITDFPLNLNGKLNKKALIERVLT